MTILGRVMAYQRPFLASAAGPGLLATAPASLSFLLASLAVSNLWLDPGGGHRLVAACCAWRATDLPRGPLLPLLGSALLVRRPVEAVWTVAATWLVLGPLEAVVGSRRLLAVAALGHVVPTVLVDLCWLAGGMAGQGLGGLDVGTSAVVVTGAAALAVATRSLPVATVLAAGLAVDIAAAPDLATAEHLIAVAVGVGLALAGLQPSGGAPRAAGTPPGRRTRRTRHGEGPVRVPRWWARIHPAFTVAAVQRCPEDGHCATQPPAPPREAHHAADRAVGARRGAAGRPGGGGPTTRP